ncbi:MAG: TonB-dependent receptor plug domain-containing protein [Bacteroidales bacterium]|nr:TonB-dependent receptor plug domain-containing protein [Bacteroidales bacterium]
MNIIGTIKSESGEPLVGATVVVKNTTIGTTTDIDGRFTITVPDKGSVLVVAFIGYSTIELTAGEQSEVDIILKEEAVTLNEVKVTALGIKKETRNIGYAVQEISGDDLKKVRDANALNSLTGKVAGLTVSPSAEMLGSPKMILRGSSDVLIVIDGVPVNSDSYNINADDVESYTVLKGPNAAALYGFRARTELCLLPQKKHPKIV